MVEFNLANSDKPKKDAIVNRNHASSLPTANTMPAFSSKLKLESQDADTF